MLPAYHLASFNPAPKNSLRRRIPGCFRGSDPPFGEANGRLDIIRTCRRRRRDFRHCTGDPTAEKQALSRISKPAAGNSSHLPPTFPTERADVPRGLISAGHHIHSPSPQSLPLKSHIFFPSLPSGRPIALSIEPSAPQNRLSGKGTCSDCEFLSKSCCCSLKSFAFQAHHF